MQNVTYINISLSGKFPFSFFWYIQLFLLFTCKNKRNMFACLLSAPLVLPPATPLPPAKIPLQKDLEIILFFLSVDYLQFLFSKVEFLTN